MGKGILKITKTGKGKIMVALDRLNDRPPMTLAYVPFTDDKLNDQPCEYQMDSSGRITSIIVDGKTVFGKDFSTPPPVTTTRPAQNQFGKDQNARPIGTHPVKSGDFQDSLRLSESKLPRSVRNLGVVDIDNFSIKYNRAARFDAIGQKHSFRFFRNDYRKLKDGRESGQKYFIRANYGSTDFQNIGTRQEEQASIMFPGNYRALQFSPDWRLICGLSGGIYETNMTLHHVYGVPYIPASSLKGVVRSWIITNAFSAAPQEESNFPLVNAEYRALKSNKLFCDIFGSPESIDRVIFSEGKPKTKKNKYESSKEISASKKEQQGSVVFMDALPVRKPELMPDIMNPHYPDWYDGKDLPTDFQSPNPIVFLTVSNDSRFQTCIGINAAKNNKLSNWADFQKLAEPVGLNGDATLLDLVEAWLRKTLAEHGVGAKTAIGYGILQ